MFLTGARFMPAGALYLRRRVFYKGNRISYLYIYIFQQELTGY